MIIYELICPKQHRFEGWFSSPEDFEGQKDGGLLSCPSCGGHDIQKLLTAKIKTSVPELLPAVREEHGGGQEKKNQPSNLQELIEYVLLNTENVGREFASEARRIHHRETPLRNIRGTASRRETEELLDEGIPVMALPIPPQGDWH